ncbi:GlpG protein (membrane protein of glp regulon) [Acidisarcina polymorpha]|uniref:GlpG protein (Membrane protein of glp regulon) n=1 Tax=Acidisarcina polymorpha TaxID=2211140 RepID=A0A2Z5G6T3_9BACT|nr:rhomboid family intramembrane serine protease [Acidisarcina polymorpha]AXC14507.1 GlpG protein (membrane protein of glp regulon) [Acidisarcina polymorpha]
MDSNWTNGRTPNRPVSVQPEILPPLAADATIPGPGEASPRTRGRWAVAPATYVLVGINIAVFLLMAFSGVSTTSPTVLQLLQWGADNGGLVLQYGEWWRLVTATFVHVGVIHLATNMWCLWNLGLLGEPLLGPIGTIAVYLLTGVAGNLLSIAVNPDLPLGPQSHSVVGAGASGAVFGIAGVLIVLLKSKLLPIPEYELKRLRKSVIYFAALNFIIGASTLLVPSLIRIDNMAHLGGFLSGLALGVPLVPRIGSRRVEFTRRQWLSFGGGVFLLALIAYGIYSFHR